jgi:hypothetical protein
MPSGEIHQYSQIANGSVVSAVSILVLDPNDTTTSPAGPNGSDKRMTVGQLALMYLALTGGTLTGWLAPAVVALTFGTTIAVNAALGNVFAVTLTASTGTLANPSNPVDGQPIRVRITQDGTGSRTLAFGTAWDFGAAGTPTLSTAAGACDYVVGEYNAAKGKWCVSFAGGY